MWPSVPPWHWPPLGVPGGPELRILGDARAYILKLSAGEQNENR
jgi:hypothetical protein